MIKKISISLFMLLVIISTAYSKRFTIDKSLGDESSWQETFNIDGKKNGKYNILVTAEDDAENKVVAGPYNIIIDAESDLPIPSITNPTENMRIIGNLNIVGTCIDDDEVDEVWLILDGDEKNPVKAKGTEYWSYDLDTSNLPEGPHTIEVYGIDNGNIEAYIDEEGNIDESKLKPKIGYYRDEKGKRKVLTWQLDRRAPVIGIKSDNHYMGELVSGKINLIGTVTDGNGIADLEYSLDGGTYYTRLKSKQEKMSRPDENGNTSFWSFNIPVDTTKFNDGPVTCRIKATDNAGSIGRYTFLFFVDNTKPEVKIITPQVDEVCYGKIVISGYVQDANGIESIKWKWGDETGEFPLTPGNPYWVKEVDSTGKNKSETFVITATDTMGNTVNVSRVIPLDQELDKPVVQILYPQDGVNIESDEDFLYLRGIATDSEGVAKVTWTLDGGEEHVVECNGVFYDKIDTLLSNGSHTISVWAEDKNGIKGNVVSSKFNAKGTAPTFKEPVLVTGKATPQEFKDGVLINPESDTAYEIAINSTCGLAVIEYEIKNDAATYAKAVPIANGANDASLKIPLNLPEIPWGVVTINVKARDIFDRETVKTSILKLQDLTSMHTETPGVYFNDSTIDEDGGVFVNENAPLTGYFAGGKIAGTPEIVPSIRGVKVSVQENSIIIESPNKTNEFTVRVTTTTGAVYESRKLHFKVPETPPVIAIDENPLFDSEKGIPFTFETPDDSLKISGSVTADSDVKLQYRILSVKADVNDWGFVTSSEVQEPTEYTRVSLNRKNQFNITNLNFNTFVDGVSVIELVATNSAGLSSAYGVFVRKIPYAPVKEVIGDDGKPLTKANPKLYWLQGLDYYGVCIYQGTTDNDIYYVRAESLSADPAPLLYNATPTDLESKKKLTSYGAEPLTVHAPVDLNAHIKSVAGIDYCSGMNVVVEKGVQKDKIPVATFTVETNAALDSAAYTLTGEKISETDVPQTGKASIRTIEEGRLYEIDVPLNNLAACITEVAVNVKCSNGYEQECKGFINVVRKEHPADNEPKVYWAPLKTAYFDKEKNSYVLNDGESLYGYINMSGSLKVVQSAGYKSISASCDGQMLKLDAASDGVFKDVVVAVTGDNGAAFNSSKVALIVDTSKPKLDLAAVNNMAYVGNSLSLSGKVSDGNGIAKLEYSVVDKKPSVKNSDGVFVDPEQEWIPLEFTKNGNFSTKLNFSIYDDGYIPLSVRVMDLAGKTNQYNYVFFKDITPPQVEVILPVAEIKKDVRNVINGENTIVFKVTDNGERATAKYVSADGKNSSDFTINMPYSLVPEKTKTNAEGEEIPLPDEENPVKTMNQRLPNMRIGTPDHPINNRMRYVFTDTAGNETAVNAWDFSVNQESDMPVSEIHLPLPNQVITTDFVISGIISDDDGGCQIYYKIDDSPYVQYENGMFTSSFKINKSLMDLSDNEHKISVYAVDRNGVKGNAVTIPIRVSMEQPKGGIISPLLIETINGSSTISGWAADKNGVKDVKVSVDNGTTYNDATGNERWTYKFDTRVIKDGTHVVFVKIVDNYDVESMYSYLINIDNTPPNLVLELPLDDSKTSKNLFFSGQTTDNIGLTDLYITVRSLEGKTIPKALQKMNLVPGEIISQVLDISSLDNGFYNIELTGRDSAGNITHVSRNIELDKARPLSKLDLLYPLNGQHLQGEFNVYGQALSDKEDEITKIELYLDGKVLTKINAEDLTTSNYFKFTLKNSMEAENPDDPPFILKEGKHTYKTVATTTKGKTVTSNEQTFVYDSYGPWIKLDNFTYGDYAVNRPLLKGSAGYSLTDEEKAKLKDKATPSEERKAIEGKRLKQIWLSFDNGKTFEPVAKPGKSNWEYRVENLDIADGIYFMLVKAEMYNGENAVTRTVVQVDKQAPSIRLLSPGEGGHYNQVLTFEGLSSDNVALKDVKIELRQGDKNTYEVPEFIQGLYFDVNVWGATLYSVGAGLTFFNDAVKVQVQYGQFTKEQRYFICDLFGVPRTDYRFGGTAIGGKIIAQIGYVPFRYFFGRDWDWLSATFALGANFQYFSDSSASKITGEPVPQIMSAAFVQIEFPRITISKNKLFRTSSFYLEPQVWFIPSDIAGEDAKKQVFTMSGGIRLNVF